MWQQHPQRPQQRGSDDIMPVWAPAASMHRALERPTASSSTMLGSIPLPALHPPAQVPVPLCQQWTLMKQIVSTVQGFRIYFSSTEVRKGGREAKQCTITLSFKEESPPGSTKYFKALSKTHWNQQRPFPFIPADTGGSCNIRHNLKALPVTLSCITNNITNSRKGTEIPASSYAVTLS